MKCLTWIYVCFSVLCLAACTARKSEKAHMPGVVAQQYVNYLIKGDYGRFVDGFSSIQNLNGDERKQIVILLKSYAKLEKEKNGGLKSAEVLKERLSKDGKKAEVTFRFVYNNRQVEETVFGMVQEKGQWKLDLKK